MMNYTPDTEENDEKKKYFNTDEYSELLLKHIIRSPEVLTAAKFNNIQPEHFLLSPIAGVRFYKQVAEVVFDYNNSPIGREVLELRIKSKGDKKLQSDNESIQEYLNYVYRGSLDVENIIADIPEFCKQREYHKVLAKKIDDPEVLHDELSKVHQDVLFREAKNKSNYYDPFDKMVEQVLANPIELGIMQIDKLQGGIARGELGLIIGHSSSGKTALSTWLARQAAIAGYKVLYISAEEPSTGISTRWYAQQFEIGYTSMYRGQAEFLKRDAISNMSEDDRRKLKNLRVIDARSMVPLTAGVIKALLEQHASDGFLADVVFVDQMDYMMPDKIMPKNSQRWVEQQQIAFECDLLSQYKITGDHEFALWLIHQATGERAWQFGFADIAGAKGIVRPFDTVIGLGREPKDADEVEESTDHVNIFSLKTRHSQRFNVAMLGEFEFMRFSPARPGFISKSAAVAAAKKQMKKGTGRPRENIIPSTTPGGEEPVKRGPGRPRKNLEQVES